MEHTSIPLDNTTLEMIKYFLGLLCTITGTFCGIFIWLGRVVSSKIESVNKSITELNTTIILIKEEFNGKHSQHETELAVIKEHLKHSVERRRTHARADE